MKKIKSLIYIFTPIIGGGIVGFLMKNSIDYGMLTKPPFSPPNEIFPIAWSIIYLLLGISYYIYKKNTDIPDKSLEKLYYLNLIVNYLWSIIFFILKLRLIACAWIILLDLLNILLIRGFSKHKKICAYLNIPYLIWCFFATYLTIGIYLLN